MNDNKFCRIIEIDNGAQVLLTKEYNNEDDSCEVKFQTEGQFRVAFSLGYESEEKRDEVYKSFTKESASSLIENILSPMEITSTEFYNC